MTFEGNYPVVRDLDGVYFRVPRDGRMVPLCWTDLTDGEREELGKGRPLSWWKSMAMHLGDQLRNVGDMLDVVWDTEAPDE